MSIPTDAPTISTAPLTDHAQSSATNRQMPQNAPECPILEKASAHATPPQPLPSPPPADNDDLDLPPDQLLVIDLLLTGGTLTQVAEAARIDRKTLYRWRHHDPRFQQFLERRRRELFDAAADRFRSLLDGALSTLSQQIHDPYAPTSHRAAKTLLTLAHLTRPTPPNLP
jgi:hypothetical protein